MARWKTEASLLDRTGSARAEGAARAYRVVDGARCSVRNAIYVAIGWRAHGQKVRPESAELVSYCSLNFMFKWSSWHGI